MSATQQYVRWPDGQCHMILKFEISKSVSGLLHHLQWDLANDYYWFLN